MTEEYEFFRGEKADPATDRERAKAQILKEAGIFAQVFCSEAGRQALEIIARKFRARSGEIEIPANPNEAIKWEALRNGYWWIHHLTEKGEGRKIAEQAL